MQEGEDKEDEGEEEVEMKEDEGEYDQLWIINNQ